MVYKYIGYNYLDIDIGEYNNYFYLIIVYSFIVFDIGGVIYCFFIMMTIN